MAVTCTAHCAQPQTHLQQRRPGCGEGRQRERRHGADLRHPFGLRINYLRNQQQGFT